MRVLIAPDSFKGTLTASEAAAAIADGWRSVRREDEVEVCPLSDGGDGLLEVVASADGWVRHEAHVPDPLGRTVTARWLRRGDAAVIESAQACGLHLVAEHERDPVRLSSAGLGPLVAAATPPGVRVLHVGLGGSATSDGGLGLLAALGADVRDADGCPVGAAGAADLSRVASAARGATERWLDLELIVLADVTTALPDAARVFGPQKGAGPADVERLTRGLAHLADVVESGFGLPGLRGLAGTGAAGGLGFAFAALGARIVDGADHVAHLVGLPGRVAAADLVIVGEGQLDATSSQGKAVGATVDLALEHGVPVAAVVGRARARPERLAAIEEASPDGPTGDAAEAVREAAARLAHLAAPRTARGGRPDRDDDGIGCG